MSIMSARRNRDLMLSACAVAIGAGLAGAACAAPGAAPASTDTTSVDAIIVTAQRRSTDVQRTPLAVTAVTAKTLDQSFITTVAGLNAVAPSLEVTKAAGFENLVTIRGIGSQTPENSLTTVPGVAEFIDGVYIANTISLDQTLFDVRDIEVLRGPQGALYGNSSIGGAISILTNQPQLKVFSGSGDVSGGTYNLFRERAEVNLPLNDSLALRLSFQKFDHDGFTKDAAIPGLTLDAAHDASGKAALLWKPTDTFSATLTAQLYRSDQAGDAQKNINDPYADPRTVYQDYPGHFALESGLYHLNLQWDLPDVTVKSVSAVQDLDHVQQEDSSRSAYTLLGAYDDVAAWNTHLHNYTQELDFLSPKGAKLEWIVGGFALYQGSKQFVEEFEGDTPPTPAALQVTPFNGTGASYPGNLHYGNLSHVTRRSFSGFVQTTYHVSSDFRLTAGARINTDSFSDFSQNFGAFGGSIANYHKTDTVPTWRLEADYDLTTNNMIYASVAHGYKPGGVNGNNGQYVVPDTFKPETNAAYELGAKNFFLERTLRLNVAAFYYQQKDFQYIEDDPVPFKSGIANIPSIHDYGVEAEVAYKALDSRLHVNGSLALERGAIDSNYKTLDSTIVNPIEASYYRCTEYGGGGVYFDPACWAKVEGAATNIKGKSPPDMPNVSGEVNASYRFDVPTGALTPRIEYIYRGQEWARIFNDPLLDKVPAYGVVNLSVDYAPTNSPLRLSLVATNVFNVAGVNSRYTDPYGTGQTSQQFIPPAQVIGTIGYSF